MQISFRVEGLPLSYNRHFQIIWAFKECHLSPEARHYKAKVKALLPPVTFKDNTRYKIKIDYHGNWYCKNGNPKRVDIQNMSKLLLDAIFEQLDKDDSFVWSMIEQYKIHDNQEYTFVTIEDINDNTNRDKS